jgi:hypothetical protein
MSQPRPTVLLARLCYAASAPRCYKLPIDKAQAIGLPPASPRSIRLTAHLPIPAPEFGTGVPLHWHF